MHLGFIIKRLNVGIGWNDLHTWERRSMSERPHCADFSLFSLQQGAPDHRQWISFKREHQILFCDKDTKQQMSVSLTRIYCSKSSWLFQTWDTSDQIQLQLHKYNSTNTNEITQIQFHKYKYNYTNTNTIKRKYKYKCKWKIPPVPPHCSKLETQAVLDFPPLTQVWRSLLDSPEWGHILT